ncbi:hypothetical protein PFISCL1PPCAC_18692, partial [Pristionchus fissidentatus]
ILQTLFLTAAATITAQTPPSVSKFECLQKCYWPEDVPRAELPPNNPYVPIPESTWYGNDAISHAYFYRGIDTLVYLSLRPYSVVPKRDKNLLSAGYYDNITVAQSECGLRCGYVNGNCRIPSAHTNTLKWRLAVTAASKELAYELIEFPKCDWHYTIVRIFKPSLPFLVFPNKTTIQNVVVKHGQVVITDA